MIFLYLCWGDAAKCNAAESDFEAVSWGENDMKRLKRQQKQEIMESASYLCEWRCFSKSLFYGEGWLLMILVLLHHVMTCQLRYRRVIL